MLTTRELAPAFAATGLGTIVTAIALDMVHQSARDQPAARRRYLQHASALPPEALAVLDYLIVAAALDTR